MRFGNREEQARRASADDREGTEPAGIAAAEEGLRSSGLRAAIAAGSPGGLGRGPVRVELNEAALLRQIDPRAVKPELLMARELGKEEEKQQYFHMERYRLLASRVAQTAAATRTRVFLTASALAEEGKTLTTANLAYAMSSARAKRVLLVELDLRRPSMRSLFQLPPPDGDEVLFLQAPDWHDALWSLRPNLHALFVNKPAEASDTLLQSEALRRLLVEARAEYDYILIDSAPLLLAVDTHVLLPLVDHVMLVVRADHTPIACCQEALGILGDKGLGCVLNDVKRLKQESYYRAYYG